MTTTMTTTATAMMKMMMVMFCVQAVAYGSSGTVEATQYPMACDTNQTATYVPSSPYTGGTFVLAANRQYLSMCLYVCLSACLFVCLSASLSVSELSKRRRRLRSERYPSVSSCLSVWVSVSASVFLPVSLSVTSSYAGDTLVLAISIALICLSIWVSVCLCVFLSFCLPVGLSVCLHPPPPPTPV